MVTPLGCQSLPEAGQAAAVRAHGLLGMNHLLHLLIGAEWGQERPLVTCPSPGQASELRSLS